MEITKEQMAQMLNGCEYGSEMTKDQEDLAKLHGLVVVFGASDDLMEMRGAIDDEFRTEVFLTKKGEVEPCEDDCKHFRRAIAKAQRIKGKFGKTGWMFDTDIPHATFNILEDGDGDDDKEQYCKGIVFHIDSLN
jgi:hypothetical protein